MLHYILLPQISRAGAWLLRSGIQNCDGGVARYYRVDTGRNNPVSTEITGYAASAFVYLHAVSGDERYLERAVSAARFLAQVAWNGEDMPFELGSPHTYFFDCGIIVRGLLAVWKVTGEQEMLDVAVAIGRAMMRHFDSGEDFHPILLLPDHEPESRDAARWSRSAGCYQLKSAMAWLSLAEAAGDASFGAPYDRVLEASLASYSEFLPGHPDPAKVVDRLHAFLYFLEGLLPRAADPRCAAALRDGILRVATHLRELAPALERSDVYAQLLRVRLWAASLDEPAARYEAEQLAGFQAADSDPHLDGGFYFGRSAGAWLPFVNPVSTVFALQALQMWQNRSEASVPPIDQLI